MAKISLRNPFYKHNGLRRNLTGPALIVLKKKNKREPKKDRRPPKEAKGSRGTGHLDGAKAKGEWRFPKGRLRRLFLKIIEGCKIDNSSC